MKANITVGTVLFVLLLSAALYLWTVDVFETPYSLDDVGMLGQMVLSVSQVDLVEAGQYNLPWSGKIWLITLVVNPQEAESIIARMGYLEDTIPNEAIAADNSQAKYDLKIRITPVIQQCIYGPDFTTFTPVAPIRAVIIEKDLGEELFSCPHENDWQEVAKQELERIKRENGFDDLPAWYTYVCLEGLPTRHAYIIGIGVGEKWASSGVLVGEAKLTLRGLYVKDRITVTAGYKTASTEINSEAGTRKEPIGTGTPTALLRYGSEIVGKVDLVGKLLADDFCPEGANYYVINNGRGWKIVPDDAEYQRYYAGYIRQIETASIYIPECQKIYSYDDLYNCKKAIVERVDRINYYLEKINQMTPVIEGKRAVRPSAEKYSASYYFAITPDKPVVYSVYRMYLKADWVGILISAAKPTIEDVTPTSISLTGPEAKTLTVTVRNIGDEGGIIVKVSCSNEFLVDGKTESSRAATLKPNDAQSFQFSISYGGSGRTAASGTCTITAISSANPNIKATRYVSVKFTPKGVYPPNTTVCVSRTTYAKTDQYGNIIPGTEKSCPEGYYCEQTATGASCVKEEITPTPQPEEGGISPAMIVAGLVLVAVLMALIFAVAL